MQMQLFSISDQQHNSLSGVFVEPESLKHQLQFDTSAAGGPFYEESRAYESRSLTVSSLHLDRTEAGISSSAHESRYQIWISMHECHYLYLILCY